MAINGPAAAYFKTATVAGTAVSLVDFGFTQAEVAAADRVIIVVETNTLRVTWDSTGVLPTTTTGMLLPTGSYPFPVITGRTNAQNLQLIRNGGSSAVVGIMIESDG